MGVGRSPTGGLAWEPDVLGDGFEAATLHLAPDSEGAVVATLVRGPNSRRSGGAVLYVHGYNDYFFQAGLARWFALHGWSFYALDLRKYGRSLRDHQTPNLCVSLTDYDEEIDAAMAAIAAEGHDHVLLMGHSTGALTLPLWAARRPGAPVAGLVLNSPFLDFSQPPIIARALGPAVARIAKRSPTRVVPAASSGLYGEGLHSSRRGEWDYELRWKPIDSFPVRFAWLAAVGAAHAQVRAGLDLPMPVLSMSSTRTVTAKEWTPELLLGDSVLDAERIALRSTRLGRLVTVARITDGMHDLVLSPRPARDEAYSVIESWLRLLDP